MSKWKKAIYPSLTEGVVCDTIYQPFTVQSWDPFASSLKAAHTLTCDPNDTHDGRVGQATSTALKVLMTSQI